MSETVQEEAGDTELENLGQRVHRVAHLSRVTTMEQSTKDRLHGKSRETDEEQCGKGLPAPSVCGQCFDEGWQD